MNDLPCAEKWVPLIEDLPHLHPHHVYTHNTITTTITPLYNPNKSNPDLRTIPPTSSKIKMSNTTTTTTTTSPINPPTTATTNNNNNPHNIPPYTPMTSLSHELGILFGFLAACFVVMGVYVFFWRGMPIPFPILIPYTSTLI